MYQARNYRKGLRASGLVSFTVVEAETDLFVMAERNLTEEISLAVKKYRKLINEYIEQHPTFKDSLVPLTADKDAAEIIKHMCMASELANVGPMAAVAGAIAHYVGNDIILLSNELIIENGGDIFLNSATDKVVSVYAGDSPLTNKIAVRILAEQMPLGVCTSSGTVGHSLSFGKADAAMVIAKDTLLADAVATKLGNMIQTAADINRSLELVAEIAGVSGALVIIDDQLGVIGDIELVEP